MTYARIASFFFLLISAVFAPPAFTLVAFVLTTAFLRRFWEGVFAALVLDSLYFSPVIFSKFHLGFFTVNFIIVVLFTDIFKEFVQGRNVLARFLYAVPGFLYFSLLFFIFF
jgi:hypothetical protein